MSIVGIVSRFVLSMPPIRGLGLVLEHASKLFSGVDRDIVTEIEGSKMIANPSIVDGRRHLFTARYHDRQEREFVRSILRAGDYAVDLGANIGSYTLLFAHIVGPDGKVTAIEAEPTNAARLRENVALNGYSHVEVIEMGAGEKHQTLALHLSGTNLGMHSFVTDEGRGDVLVKCAPLSEMICLQPRLLKIDIELYEYKVLNRYFADGSPKPDFIMIEDWGVAREGDAVKLCLSHGYREVCRFDANVMLALVKLANS